MLREIIEARTPKIFKIRVKRKGRANFQVGTLEQLIEAYSYTLEVGQSWEHEQGNVKINRNPKSIKTLVENLNNASTNAAADGEASEYYSEVRVTKADKAEWISDNVEVV